MKLTATVPDTRKISLSVSALSVTCVVPALNVSCLLWRKAR